MRISDWSSDVCSSDLPFAYSPRNKGAWQAAIGLFQLKANIDRDGHLGFARHHRRIGHLGLGHRNAGNRIGHGWRNGPALAARDDTLQPHSRSLGVKLTPLARLYKARGTRPCNRATGRTQE